MPVAVILVAVAALFYLAFRTYGRLLARRFCLDPDATTPAHVINDGDDYVPTRKLYLLSQHFSAISAAGPIVGPIAAALAFGWGPALIWVVLGAIFIGAMHDFSALAGSVKHGARSVAEIIREHMSGRAYLLFVAFVWFALVYVIVAFTDITSRTFVKNLDLGNDPTVRGAGVATSSMLYLGLGVLLGIVLRLGLKLWIATAIFLPLVALSIWGGQKWPLEMPAVTLPLVGELSPILMWDYLILAYCGVASVTPVWALLQPRGHLGGFFLYGVMGMSLVGILLGGMKVEYPAFVAYAPAMGPMFPILFVTIACGACSGFHGMVCSGTTSKQLDRETDAHLVGYGGMLLEGLVATISIITVMLLVQGSPDAKETASSIFARGVGRFLDVFGIDRRFATSFGLLAFATFIFDTLDVATRLGRYMLQELWSGGRSGDRRPSKASAVIATLVTLVVPGFFMSARLVGANGQPVAAWEVFWGVFGTSNQLMAGLTLLGIAVWLRRTGKRAAANLVLLPMIFMLAMTLWSLGLMITRWWNAGRFGDPVGWVALILLLLAALLAAEATRVLRSARATS